MANNAWARRNDVQKMHTTTINEKINESAIIYGMVFPFPFGFLAGMCNRSKWIGNDDDSDTDDDDDDDHDDEEWTCVVQCNTKIHSKAERKRDEKAPL